MSWAVQSSDWQQERWHISDVTGQPTAGFMLRWDAEGVTVLEVQKIRGGDVCWLKERARWKVGNVQFRYEPELPGIAVRMGEQEIGIADSDVWAK